MTLIFPQDFGQAPFNLILAVSEYHKLLQELSQEPQEVVASIVGSLAPISPTPVVYKVYWCDHRSILRKQSIKCVGLPNYMYVYVHAR